MIRLGVIGDMILNKGLPHFFSVSSVAQRFVLTGMAVTLTACSALLPRSTEITDSPWRSYEDAQRAFDEIVAGKTTLADLKRMSLDPASNPNVTILSYSDVMRRFVGVGAAETSMLESGVNDCLRAGSRCQGFEVDHRVVRRKRHGNFLADIFNFNRKTEINGWRFKGVVLVANQVVTYKLTGGQPTIHENEETTNPLGPFQGAAEKLLR